LRARTNTGITSDARRPLTRVNTRRASYHCVYSGNEIHLKNRFGEGIFFTSVARPSLCLS